MRAGSGTVVRSSLALLASGGMVPRLNDEKETDMTRMMIALGFAAGLATLPALAQDMPADADGNGTWSMEELKATYPNLTEEAFAAMDTSADGQVDAAEYEAAMGANLLNQ